MKLQTRPPRRHERLEQLVHNDLRGAELKNWTLTEEDGGTLEQVYVVIWHDDIKGEWGTHRAVINYELGESALMWGHYFRGPDAIVAAYQDFHKRGGEGT